MTLHQLRIFEAVVRHLNLTRAAAELHISQPSVFQQVKLLGEEYGVKLYRKIGRGIELTDDGRSFLSNARPILFHVEKLKRNFTSNLNDSKTGNLTIGGSFGPSASFLPLLSAHFRKTHPQVHVTLLTNLSPVIEKLVLNSEVDIALITNPSHSPSLIYEPCRKETLVTFVSVKHPLAKRRELNLAELARAPLIVRKGKADVGSTWEILKQLEERGLKLNIIMDCELPEGVKAAVKTGMGLGILYRDIVEPDIRAGDLKIINVPELKMRVDSFITYHKNKSLSPNAQDFLSLLRKWRRMRRGVKGSLRVA